MVLDLARFVVADYAQDSNLTGIANGMTLTASTNPSAALSVDSVALSVGDIVLLVAQTTASENGYYVLTQQGDGATTNWVLTRQDPGLKIFNLQAYYVNSGALLAGSMWILTGSDDPLTPGASSLTFTQVSVENASPVANIVQLTDSTGGTATDTLSASGDTSSSDQSTIINDNFASNAAKINAILQALEDLGLMQAP